MSVLTAGYTEGKNHTDKSTPIPLSGGVSRHTTGLHTVTKKTEPGPQVEAVEAVSALWPTDRSLPPGQSLIIHTPLGLCRRGTHDTAQRASAVGGATESATGGATGTQVFWVFRVYEQQRGATIASPAHQEAAG